MQCRKFFSLRISGLLFFFPFSPGEKEREKEIERDG